VNQDGLNREAGWDLQESRLQHDGSYSVLLWVLAGDNTWHITTIYKKQQYDVVAD
jgi:hypothetical protein